MQVPEEYNVLHIGPETSSAAQDKKILTVLKKLQFSKVGTRVLIGLALVTVFGLGTSLYGTVQSTENRVDALIDELGKLSASNFELSEQVTSQDAVLRSIEEDFSNLGSALEKGDKDEIGALFTSILEKFEDTPNALDLSQDVQLSEIEDETFDILLLGTNGAHTDTIMVASVNKEKEKISLFSVPRDLYVNGRKINEYYTYYGVETLKRMLETVTGLQIDQYAQVDLKGFVEIVAALGGVDVYVTESIYDGLYPNSKGGYSPYSIEKGKHHLDGNEALKYARSRESTSDFDRAERQQVILAAVREKITQLDSVMELKELTEVLQTALSHSTTDLDVLDLVSYYFDYKDYDLNTGFVLNSGNYLYSLINEGGAYILLPRTGNYEEIHGVISDLVN
ncbi:LCP family protein [Candidatus Peregrinibacteria bacterium]|nr:MAG: LCP family protein [Candidatus Peregrinibacteria bacterium]